MKYTILALALLAAFNASATGNECRGNCTGGSTTHFNQAQSMLQGQTHYNAVQTHSTSNGGISTSNSGGNSINVQGDDVTFPKIANSAIAPSVTSNVICPIVSPSSKAGSVWFASASGTTGTTLNAICVAFHLNQPAVVEAMTCNADSAYRKANPNCAVK